MISSKQQRLPIRLQEFLHKSGQPNAFETARWESEATPTIRHHTKNKHNTQSIMNDFYLTMKTSDENNGFHSHSRQEEIVGETPSQGRHPESQARTPAKRNVIP